MTIAQAGTDAAPPDKHKVIFGVALLAICTLAGVTLGDALGTLLGVKANVGGVGIAMILLIAARLWLARHGLLGQGLRMGVDLWGALYIPIVVAMAAQQNVVAAVRGGPIVFVAGVGATALCFASVALLGRIGRNGSSADTLSKEEGVEA